MELINEESASELLQAQTQVWNHIFNFINSMTLKCAVQLGIPDVIHKHGKPMTLSELVSSLPIHPSKTQYVHRIMRILVHSGFFSQQNLNGGPNQEAYFLSQSGRLLLEDSPLSMRPLLLMLLDPVLTKPWDCLSTWFRNDEVTAFSVAHGRTLWEYAGQDPRLNNLFNAAMANDSVLVSKVIVSKCKGIFEGVSSLVDVGGGVGTMATAISEAFPHIHCTVFDLPHVVSDLQGSKNLEYAAGDMLEAVPPADALLLKWILHDWSDEDCIKILQQCKQAIMRNEKQKKVGKVIIIDMVRENQNRDEMSAETRLFFDLEMMVTVNGMERNEKEWGKLFFDAGFLNYKIHPVIVLVSYSKLKLTYGIIFINSMTLKCAVQLGIPDAIHKHGKPMTLSQLVSALPIHPSKTQYVHRLMRILVHSGFFSQQNLNGINDDQEVYSLSQSARLLLEDSPLSMRPLLLILLDPVVTKPWDCLSTWFRNDEVTAFSVAHGKTIWEYTGQDPRLSNLFNEAMASDSVLVSKVIVSKCKGMILVDVGGGTGTMAKAISEAFPHIDCTVFDLPRVVSDLQGSKNLKYVGGDMFEVVPPADAVLLKWILHDWSDEDCIKILQRCKQAIMRNGKQKVGKVIIIDMVRENKNRDEAVSTETQLFFDLEMMVTVNGMERNEKEWGKLFFDAGFLNYKIHSVLGTRSLIELHP
uniref:O-methyltransferase domain-containing protein n=1 Tax=Salix viminalis TaxID=40686 RepID=A0A6N2MMG0_SALVM